MSRNNPLEANHNTAADRAKWSKERSFRLNPRLVPYEQKLPRNGVYIRKGFRSFSLGPTVTPRIRTIDDDVLLIGRAGTVLTAERWLRTILTA